MKSFTKIVLKIISFCIMLRSLTYIQGLVMLLLSNENANYPNFIINLTYTAFSALFYIILGILVWVFADKISLLIVQKDENGLSMSLPVKPLLRSAIVVIGIFILANTIPSIIGNVYQLLLIRDQIKDQTAISGFNGLLEIKSAIITDLIKVIIAVFIIAGHKWLVSFSEYLKVEEKKDEEGNTD